MEISHFMNISIGLDFRRSVGTGGKRLGPVRPGLVSAKGLWLAALLLAASATSTGQTVTITEFPVPTAGSDPFLIAAGPDGALWFGEFLGNNIGRISTGGAIAEYAVPTANSNPGGIAAGRDGALWKTAQTWPMPSRLNVKPWRKAPPRWPASNGTSRCNPLSCPIRCGSLRQPIARSANSIVPPKTDL